MHLPTPQGLSSPTFKQPPLDGSLLLPEIFDYHAQYSPEHPLFYYVDVDNAPHTIPWAKAVQAFHKAAQIVRQQANEAVETRPVIGIVASAGQYMYVWHATDKCL